MSHQASLHVARKCFGRRTLSAKQPASGNEVNLADAPGEVVDNCGPGSKGIVHTLFVTSTGGGVNGNFMLGKATKNEKAQEPPYKYQQYYGQYMALDGQTARYDLGIRFDDGLTFARMNGGTAFSIVYTLDPPEDKAWTTKPQEP